jgi:hypothetical protein
MQARFYLPWVGRFGSPDPARDQHFEQTQSWNIYSYVTNSPTMLVDPNGEAAQDPQPNSAKPTTSGRLANLTGRSFANPSSLPKTKFGAWVEKEVSHIFSKENLVNGLMILATEGRSEAEPSKIQLQPELELKPPVELTPAAPLEGAPEAAPEAGPKNKFPDRPLPRDANGNPTPDPEATGPHSQLGQKEGRRGKYDQAREFDKNGKPVKDIDFTDHGRSDHTNPHQHRYKENPTGGTPQRGKAEPLQHP